jgi:hypothetical protein
MPKNPDILQIRLRYLLKETLDYMRMDEIKMNKQKKEPVRVYKVIDGTPYISSKEFCRMFICSMEEAGSFRRQGMPAKKDGKGYIYNVEKCQAWFRGDN